MHVLHLCVLLKQSSGKEKYLLQQPQDGIILQVRNILLQIRLLLSLVSDPIQHLEGKYVISTHWDDKGPKGIRQIKYW